MIDISVLVSVWHSQENRNHSANFKQAEFNPEKKGSTVVGGTTRAKAKQRVIGWAKERWYWETATLLFWNPQACNCCRILETLLHLALDPPPKLQRWQELWCQQVCCLCSGCRNPNLSYSSCRHKMTSSNSHIYIERRQTFHSFSALWFPTAISYWQCLEKAPSKADWEIRLATPVLSSLKPRDKWIANTAVAQSMTDCVVWLKSHSSLCG